MKKKTIVILIIIVAILIGIGALIYTNIGNIKAIKDGFSYSPDRINEMIAENERAENEVLESLGIKKINPLTEEEVSELLSGKITEEDAICLVLGKTEPEDIETENIETPAEENTIPEKEANDKAEANAEIEKLVAKMYVLKSTFTSGLDSLIDRFTAEYMSLSPQMRASSSVKTKLGLKAINEATHMESECDAQVNEIFNQIEDLLKNSGQDTALVNTIRTTYENEKQIKKASYISEYKKHSKILPIGEKK